MGRPAGVGEPTLKQRKMVDIMISGEANSPKDAVRKTYAEKSVNKSHKLWRAMGVQKYLAQLDKEARANGGQSLQHKVVKTYDDALSATKLYGKNAISHPDFRTRIEAADRFSKLFGWASGNGDPAGDTKKFSQFNFFNVDPSRQKEFHDNLKSIIHKSYGGSEPTDAK